MWGGVLLSLSSADVCRLRSGCITYLLGLSECSPAHSQTQLVQYRRFYPSASCPIQMHKAPFGIRQSSTKLKCASIINMSSSVGTLCDWMRCEGHMTERQSVMGRDENSLAGNVILEQSRQELRSNSQFTARHSSCSHHEITLSILSLHRAAL